MVRSNRVEFVDGPRVKALEPEIAFCPDEIEGRCLMEGVKAIETQTLVVRNLEGFRFEV